MLNNDEYNHHRHHHHHQVVSGLGYENKWYPFSTESIFNSSAALFTVVTG